MTSPATFASWRTSLSAQRSSPAAQVSLSSICRKVCALPPTDVRARTNRQRCQKLRLATFEKFWLRQMETRLRPHVSSASVERTYMSGWQGKDRRQKSDVSKEE